MKKLISRLKNQSITDRCIFTEGIWFDDTGSLITYLGIVGYIEKLSFVSQVKYKKNFVSKGTARLFLPVALSPLPLQHSQPKIRLIF